MPPLGHHNELWTRCDGNDLILHHKRHIQLSNDLSLSSKILLVSPPTTQVPTESFIILTIMAGCADVGGDGECLAKSWLCNQFAAHVCTLFTPIL